QIVDLYQRITERIEAVSGVRSAALSRHPLLSGSRRASNIFVEGGAQQTTDAVFINLVSNRFFETMEIPLVLGRNINARDDARAPKVAVINQTLARKYFGDENPLGRHFSFGAEASAEQIEIVGIVRDAKYTSLRQQMQPTLYTPYTQETIGQMNF